VLAAIALLAAVVAGGVWYAYQQLHPPIRIGLAINLSGQGGTANEYVREGAMLATEEVNRTGGINGRPLELIVRDDRNTPEGIVGADNDLIGQNVIAIVGHVTSQNTLISYPVVTSAGVLLFNPYTAATEFVGKDDLLIRTNVSNRQNAERTASLLLEKHAAVTSFLMDMSNRSYVYDYFQRTSEHYPGKAVEVHFEHNAHSMWGALIEELLAPQPEAIVLLTDVSTTGIAAQKLRSSGFTGPLFATHWAQSPGLMRVGGSAVEGLAIVSYMDPENERPQFLAFSEEMHRRVGHSPSARSTSAYEAVQILATALRRCTAPTTEQLRKQLLSGTFRSLMGQVDFDAFGDVERPIYEIHVRNGRFARIRQLD